jgi:mannose-6-phosphate isomerase-like protein (cupin superfamily)
MSKIQIKRIVVALVFTYVATGVFISGCSMDKGAAMSSGKPLVIELNNNAEYQPLLRGVPQTCGMHAGKVYLQPGEVCGQHSTQQHEEMLVFLSGKGTALIGEEKTAFAVGNGKVCYIPPHTLHNISNTGTEPLVYIYCVAPVQSGSEGHSEQQENHH